MITIIINIIMIIMMIIIIMIMIINMYCQFSNVMLVFAA